MDDERKLEYVNNIISGCLLPELINELGNFCLESKDFDNFRNSLDIQLMQLFDFVQQNEFLVFRCNPEIKCSFILLLCEQTAPCTLFQTKSSDLLRHLHILTEKYLNKLVCEDSTLETRLFNFYKEKLTLDKWKKQLGATHGFVQFLKLRYKAAGAELPSDVCTFILSVGLLLNEFYEPAYKELSFQIFSTLLSRAKNDFARDLNLHNVIYNAIVGDFSKVDSAEGTTCLCDCLFKCVELTEGVDFSKWSKVDEVIEAAIRRITFAPNSDVVSVLFVFISKISVHFSANRNEVIPFLENNLVPPFPENINKVRSSCSEITSRASYRWAKKLLNLLVAESSFLMGSCRTSCSILWAMHICYLVCILPISINILRLHIAEFLKKFIPLLMEGVRINKEEEEFRKAVLEILKSFLYHIESYESKDNRIFYYQNAIQKILEQNVFVIKE